MDTDSEMFLLAAEELNFTRAAKRAYVTQQCLSAHIKKLEIRMGAPLFERVPYMALTPAGKVLYRSLRRIELIERSCREKYRSHSGRDAGGSDPWHECRACPVLSAAFV